MPLPLIPVVIMMGLASAGGVGAGVDGVRRLGKARGCATSAVTRRDEALAQATRAFNRTDRRAKAYGTLQLNIQRDTLGAWATWLRDNERKVRELDGQFVDGVEIRPIDLPQLQAETLEADRLLTDGLKAGLAGVLARQAAISGVRSLATASTGTAISQLTGAAAHNAAWAWMGGGTIASGGGGMAAGTVVLTGFGVVPAVLITGLSLNVQGQRAQTRARQVQAAAAVDTERLRIQRAMFLRLARRIDELDRLLRQFDQRARTSLEQLQAAPFDPARDIEPFMRTAQLMQAVREILQTPLVADGRMTPESEHILVKHQTS